MIDTDRIDRDGIALLELKLSRYLNYIFRELTTSDRGIDGVIEPREPRHDSFILAGAQVKSTEKLDTTKDNIYTYYASPRHYTYWAESPIPNFIFVVDLELDEVYWQYLVPANFRKTPSGKYAVDIPSGQKLSPTSITVIDKIIEEHYAHARRPTADYNIDECTIFQLLYLIDDNNNNWNSLLRQVASTSKSIAEEVRELNQEYDDLENRKLHENSFYIGRHDYKLVQLINRTQSKWDASHIPVLDNYKEYVEFSIELSKKLASFHDDGLLKMACQSLKEALEFSKLIRMSLATSLVQVVSKYSTQPTEQLRIATDTLVEYRTDLMRRINSHYSDLDAHHGSLCDNG